MDTEIDLPIEDRKAGPRTPEELPAGIPATASRIPAGLPQNSSLPVQVVKLAIWPFLEQCMGFLVGFVDTALAGHLSANATSAIGVAAYVLWLMYLLINAVGVGSTAYISRAAGAGRWKRAGIILGQSLGLAAIWGLVVAVGLYIFAADIGQIGGLKQPGMGMSTEYLQLLALVVPCNAILGIGSACLRGSGDTRSPFIIMVVVNLVNIVASVLLVDARSPIGGHGIQGIAIGTMLAWFVGAVLIVGVLLKGRGKLKLIPKHLKLRMVWLQRIIRVGLPNLFENVGVWGGNFLVLGVVVGRLAEEHALGSHVVGIRLEAVSYLPGLALGIVAATMVGQYLGVGDKAMARKAVLWCWLMSALIMTFCGLLFLFIPDVLVGVMTNQPVFLERSPQLLFHAGWSQFFFATYLVISSALRGAGDTRSALMLSFGSLFLVRLPLIYFLAITLEYGLVGVWIATSIELVFRGTIFFLRFWFGRWEKALVL